MEYMDPRARMLLADCCAGKAVMLSADHLPLINNTIYPKESLLGFFPTAAIIASSRL